MRPNDIYLRSEKGVPTVQRSVSERPGGFKATNENRPKVAINLVDVMHRRYADPAVGASQPGHARRSRLHDSKSLRQQFKRQQWQHPQANRESSHQDSSEKQEGSAEPKRWRLAKHQQASNDKRTSTNKDQRTDKEAGRKQERWHVLFHY